jgi:drug/metabolite transporter (DMT)-like permease
VTTLNGRIPFTRGWGVALAFMTACISGVAVYVNGFAVAAFADATVYTTVKNGIAAAVLLATLAAVTARRRPAPLAASRHERAGLLVVAVVGGSVPFVLFFEGLARASATEAAFIHKTLILWVTLLAVPLLRERLSGWHAAAIGLLLAGQVAAAGDLLAIRLGDGELMIFAATLLWAAEFVLAKRLLRTFGSLTLGSARLGFGLVVLVAWLAVTGRAGEILALTAQQWAWAVLTGVILAGFVAGWYAALARAQAVDVAAVLVFAAVITAALSGAFQDVVPAGAVAWGLVLIALGTAAAVAGVLRRQVPTPEEVR